MTIVDMWFRVDGDPFCGRIAFEVCAGVYLVDIYNMDGYFTHSRLADIDILMQYSFFDTPDDVLEFAQLQREKPETA